MRKIISKAEEEKKRQRNQILLGIILIFVMFFSVLGYGFSGDSDENDKIEYNGFDFYEKDGLWYLEIENSYFIFKNNPKEIGNIETENISSISDYYNKPLYISSENNEASYEIYNNLERIAERIQSACLNKEDCDGNYPIKTCKDNFIIIKEKNESSIIQNESCVFIYGSNENLIELTDEFLFKILEIKE
jgi:hypothetical protein